MTKEQIDFYRLGYDDCSLLVQRKLISILGVTDGPLDELQFLLNHLKTEMDARNWLQIQEEFPGITHEEYEAELEASFQAIKREFYSENGYLKPRLAPKNSYIASGNGEP